MRYPYIEIIVNPDMVKHRSTSCFDIMPLTREEVEENMHIQCGDYHTSVAIDGELKSRVVVLADELEYLDNLQAHMRQLIVHHFACPETIRWAMDQKELQITRMSYEYLLSVYGTDDED